MYEFKENELVAGNFDFHAEDVSQGNKNRARYHCMQKEFVSDILQGTRNDSLVITGKSDHEPPTKRVCKRSRKEEVETGTFNFTNCSVVFNINK